MKVAVDSVKQLQLEKIENWNGWTKCYI